MTETEPACICPLDVDACQVHRRTSMVGHLIPTLLDEFAAEPEHLRADSITQDALDKLCRELNEARKYVAIAQTAAADRRAMHQEARDLLHDAGHQAHGECWPDILAPIRSLTAERDRLAARIAEYDAAIGWETTCLNCARLTTRAWKDTARAARAESAVARARAYAEGLKCRPAGHSLTAVGCGDRFLAALDRTSPGATTTTGTARQPESYAALLAERNRLGALVDEWRIYGTCRAIDAREAEATVQRVRDLHPRVTVYRPAEDCSCPDDPYADNPRHQVYEVGEYTCLDSPVGDVCGSCTVRDGDELDSHNWRNVNWPCPTGVALDGEAEPESPVTHSEDEWRNILAKSLDRLGITWEQLAAMAGAGRFTSDVAEGLWIAAGRRGAWPEESSRSRSCSAPGELDVVVSDAGGVEPPAVEPSSIRLSWGEIVVANNVAGIISFPVHRDECDPVDMDVELGAEEAQLLARMLFDLAGGMLGRESDGVYEWTEFVVARGTERLVAVGLESAGEQVGELRLDRERAAALGTTLLAVVGEDDPLVVERVAALTGVLTAMCPADGDDGQIVDDPARIAALAVAVLDRHSVVHGAPGVVSVSETTPNGLEVGVALGRDTLSRSWSETEPR